MINMDLIRKTLAKLPLLLLVHFLTPNYGQAEEPTQVRVAIIDTGIVNYKGPLCSDVGRDFTGTSLADKVGHGTEVANIIAKQAPQHGWCLISLKYTNFDGSPSGVNYVKALKHALTLNLDVLNLSLSGLSPILEEKIAIKKLLDQGVRVVVAAGNQRLNLDLDCVAYPTCIDKRAIVVANTEKSNTGSIVDFTVPSPKGPAYGTSGSAALVTGQLVRLLMEGAK